MKKLFTRVLDFVLIMSIALNIPATAFASESREVINATDRISSQEEIEVSREAYFSLTPEAKIIFDQSLANDPDMLEFHKAYVDSSFTVPAKTAQNMPKAQMRAAAVSDPMQILMRELSALGLPSAVLYSLKATGAGIVAAIADGPFPFGDIVLAATAAGTVVVIAANWNVVSPKFNQITAAFKTAFKSISSKISSAFSKIKTEVKKEVDKKAKEKAKTESEKRVNDVLKGKTKERKTSGNTNIYNGSGGQKAADKDFNKLNQGKTTTYTNGTKVGQLPDGTKINVRPKSSDGRVTLEVQGKGKYNVKIRY